MFLWSYYTFEQYLAVCITQIISHNSGCLWLWGESGWCAVVDCMQQSFEGLQTAATAKFGWRMKHTGISSTPRNDRLLHIDYLWIAGCSIQDWPTLCVHAIVLGMQILDPNTNPINPPNSLWVLDQPNPLCPWVLVPPKKNTTSAGQETKTREEEEETFWVPGHWVTP